jgi:chromosome segregation ATPase
VRHLPADGNWLEAADRVVEAEGLAGLVAKLSTSVGWHQAQLERLSAELESAHARATELDAHLQWHVGALARVQESLDWHVGVLELRDARIGELEAAINEARESLAWHVDALEQSAESIDWYRREIERRDAEIRRLKRQLDIDDAAHRLVHQSEPATTS